MPFIPTASSGAFWHFEEKMHSRIDDYGTTGQVDISSKEATSREASAMAEILLKPETIKAIIEHSIPKGNVFEVARIAGISAAKKTSELIPLCHAIPLNHTDIQISIKGNKIIISSYVKAFYRTGVEMEAITAAAVSAITIYDMCKSIDRSAAITNIRLLSKKGGKSGEFTLNK
jgi:cyclic pyranopterin phosphate synthase